MHYSCTTSAVVHLGYGTAVQLSDACVIVTHAKYEMSQTLNLRRIKVSRISSSSVQPTFEEIKFSFRFLLDVSL